MISPKRVRHLANISKSFTDQGMDPPDPSIFKDSKGKPLSNGAIRRLARSLGCSLKEQEARQLLKD